MKNGHKKQPDLFKKRVYALTGLDRGPVLVAAHGRDGCVGATSGPWSAIKEWLLRREGVALP